jgi:hypothetical protein
MCMARFTVYVWLKDYKKECGTNSVDQAILELRFRILYFFLVICTYLNIKVFKKIDWAIIGGDTIVLLSPRLSGIDFCVV